MRLCDGATFGGLRLPWCVARLERRFGEALDGLHSIRSLALVPMLDYAAERPHEGYRWLERKTDPDAASRLLDTVAAVEPHALYAALQAKMQLFRSLRAAVFDRYGLIFEEMLESEMSRRWVAREAQ